MYRAYWLHLKQHLPQLLSLSTALRLFRPAVILWPADLATIVWAKAGQGSRLRQLQRQQTLHSRHKHMIVGQQHQNSLIVHNQHLLLWMVPLSPTASTVRRPIITEADALTRLMLPQSCNQQKAHSTLDGKQNQQQPRVPAVRLKAMQPFLQD